MKHFKNKSKAAEAVMNNYCHFNAHTKCGKKNERKQTDLLVQDCYIPGRANGMSLSSAR